MSISMPSSKKLSAAIVGVLLVVLNDVFAWGISPEAVQKTVAVVMAYVIGQGVADLGKEKVKAEQKAAAPPPGGTA